MSKCQERHWLLSHCYEWLHLMFIQTLWMCGEISVTSTFPSSLFSFSLIRAHAKEACDAMPQRIEFERHLHQWFVRDCCYPQLHFLTNQKIGTSASSAIQTSMCATASSNNAASFFLLSDQAIAWTTVWTSMRDFKCLILVQCRAVSHFLLHLFSPAKFGTEFPLISIFLDPLSHSFMRMTTPEQLSSCIPSAFCSSFLLFFLLSSPSQEWIRFSVESSSRTIVARREREAGRHAIHAMRRNLCHRTSSGRQKGGKEDKGRDSTERSGEEAHIWPSPPDSVWMHISTAVDDEDSGTGRLRKPHVFLLPSCCMPRPRLVSHPCSSSSAWTTSGVFRRNRISLDPAALLSSLFPYFGGRRRKSRSLFLFPLTCHPTHFRFTLCKRGAKRVKPLLFPWNLESEEELTSDQQQLCWKRISSQLNYLSAKPQIHFCLQTRPPTESSIGFLFFPPLSSKELQSTLSASEDLNWEKKMRMSLSRRFGVSLIWFQKCIKNSFATQNSASWTAFPNHGHLCASNPCTKWNEYDSSTTTAPCPQNTTNHNLNKYLSSDSCKTCRHSPSVAQWSNDIKASQGCHTCTMARRSWLQQSNTQPLSVPSWPVRLDGRQPAPVPLSINIRPLCVRQFKWITRCKEEECAVRLWSWHGEWMG